MSYSEIDQVILQWVEKHNFNLFTRYGDESTLECRAVYLSSQQNECCQIWIEEPNLENVRVHAGDIETINDEELDKQWCIPVNELPETLEIAVNFVKDWFNRKSA